jgi:GGDEF domain-containing protein
VLVLLSLSEADTVTRRYGQDALAALLTRVATTLGSQCRASDVPFRHSADSLGVYLHCDSIEQADAFGRRIRMLLASQQLEWRGDVLKPTVAMGVAAVEVGVALPQLYRRAEGALAEA